MKIRHFQKIRWTVILAAVAFAVSSLYPIRALAIESIMLPVHVMGDDVVSIALPIVSESETSVFDFIMDPQGLLYETEAIRYGGGTVEEGATLLFFNKEGEYDFSGHSDWLTVTNRSTVPVQVTVMAQIIDFGDIRLVENDDFGESTEPEIYLAIEDDKGNIMPLSADGQATIDLEMAAVPENTYVFRIDEENHTYEYGPSMDPDKVGFDTYSFGLIGACNSNADWQDISIHPTITVTWYVEPMISEEQEEITEDGLVEEENESVADDDIEKDVPVDESDDENSEDNTSGDSEDDEDKSDDESDEKKDEDNGNGGSDDENQSNNKSDNENNEDNEDNAAGDKDNKDQSDDESDDGNDNNNLDDNGLNEDAGSGTTE